MKKNLKPKKTSGPKVDPYLEGLVAKLIDRLVSLEKKMDALLSRAGGKPAGNSPEAPAQEAPRRERTLYEAICADCSKVCEVPFKPVEGRAVYCKTCFGKRKSGGAKHGMPILTPVALPPKPAGKLGMAQTPPSQDASKKTKKKPAAKKASKKK